MEELYVKRIEEYLKHSLGEEESRKLEKDLQTDKELKRLFDEYKLAMDVLDIQIENDLRLKFAQWKSEKKHVVTRRITMITAMAASIVILIGLFLFFGPKQTPDSYNQLALEYYNLPETPAHSMGDEQISWEKGLKAYSEKSYMEAIAEWETIKNPDPEVQYYLAHSYFNIEKFNKASHIFRQLSKGTNIYSYPSDWFLVLSYLSADQIDQYNQTLEKIVSNEEHPYYPDAIELKRKVEKQKSKN